MHLFDTKIYEKMFPEISNENLLEDLIDFDDEQCLLLDKKYFKNCVPRNV